MRGGGSSVQAAVAASVGLHALLAAGLLCAGRWRAARPEPPRPAALDTRVESGPRVEIGFAEVDVATTRPEPPASRPGLAKETEPPKPVEPAAATGPPLAAPPRTLPPELLAVVRRPTPAGPVGPEVVEVPVAPTPSRPRPNADVRPAGRAAAAPPARAGSDAAVSPVHGPLNPNQVIVYVLDASGSMGEAGKFDAARRALVATLRAQPETVRFQVVVYSAAARPLVPGPCVPATAENVRQAEARLAALEPAGRSSHAEGVRAAVALRPDFILLLTDADDLPAAKIRGALGHATRPVTACVARVTAAGVGTPAEVK